MSRLHRDSRSSMVAMARMKSFCGRDATRPSTDLGKDVADAGTFPLHYVALIVCFDAISLP
jgi:hypothetical protein